MSDTTINVVTLEGAKLSLSSGDTLVVMYPQILHAEQMQRLSAHLAKAIPEGVKAIILDGGATVAAITQEKPKTQTQ